MLPSRTATTRTTRKLPLAWLMKKKVYRSIIERKRQEQQTEPHRSDPPEATNSERETCKLHKQQSMCSSYRSAAAVHEFTQSLRCLEAGTYTTKYSIHRANESRQYSNVWWNGDTSRHVLQIAPHQEQPSIMQYTCTYQTQHCIVRYRGLQTKERERASLLAKVSCYQYGI